MAWDFKNPDYVSEFRRRAEALERIRAEPDCIPTLKAYYRDGHIADFISDWGMTYDPRNVEIGLPAAVPFVLFPKQRDFVDYVIRKWKARESGIGEKSRECGVSWLIMSLGCAVCILHTGVSVGYGSRKEEYVDKIGDPKSLFWKGRFFMSALPVEFRAGWTAADAPHMRIMFPETESSMGGEGGDNIGRGDRRSIYFVDEAAHLEHPELVDAALSMTTNCRIDVSSVNGRANSFAQRRHSGAIEVFTFHWRDDPRKDQAWYDKKVAELNNPVIVAQELDIDYSASVEGVLIPSAWVQAAVDAHKKLGIEATGDKFGAFDVADEGKDLCAFCGAHGVVIEELVEWTGKGDDTFGSAQKVFLLCDQLGYKKFRYDADGLGAYIRGDARVINEGRTNPYNPIEVEAFRGSAEVWRPEAEDVKGRSNKDFFQNANSQAWWDLRTRFMLTYRAVNGDTGVDRDEIISISSDIDRKILNKLMVELSQPQYKLNGAGKVVIEKTPEGMHSPNLADAVKIRFAPDRNRPKINRKLIERVAMMRRG